MRFPWLLVACILTVSSLTLKAQSDTIPARNEHTLVLSSAILREQRTIWVHLPPDYHPADKQQYPVIYLLDGQVHFNYVSGMVEYLSSYDVNRMPKAIVVGIIQENRGKDLIIKHPQTDSTALEGTGAALFLRFIREELVPYVDKQFNTAPYRILVGHSLAGLFAFYAKQEAPTLFQATVLLSPAIGGVDEYLTNRFNTFLRQHPASKDKYFITIGNENTRQVQTLANILQTAAPKNVQWHYQPYPDENHFSVTYKGIYDALKFIYTPWFFDYYGKTNLTYNEITQRFNQLSTEYGYPVTPPETFVNNIGYRQLRSGNFNEAIDIFRHNIDNFPASYNAYDSMGEAYMLKGDTATAIRYYEKSLELNPQNEDAKAYLKNLKKP